MIRFAHPLLLWLLLALPLVAFLRSRRGTDGRPCVTPASPPRAPWRAPAVARWVGSCLPYLRLPAAALLIVALARPQVGHASSKVEASGVDMMLALDVSGSMQALDLQLDGAARRSAHGREVGRLQVHRRAARTIGWASSPSPASRSWSAR